MRRRSNVTARWWDSNLKGGLGHVEIAESSERQKLLLSDVCESDIADMKKLNVVVDMGRDANRHGVVVISTSKLLGKGDRGWDLALVHLVFPYPPVSNAAVLFCFFACADLQCCFSFYLTARHCHQRK
jgi:hypothetical protein